PVAGALRAGRANTIEWARAAEGGCAAEARPGVPVEDLWLNRRVTVLHSDRRRRKKLIDDYKAREYAQVRERLGSTAESWVLLLGYFEDRLVEVFRDHLPRFMREWAEQNGHEKQRVEDGVTAFGGYCDCEVAANVTPDK